MKYKWKLRIILASHSREILNIQQISWKGAGKAQFLHPEDIVFELEDNIGTWVANQWTGKESPVGLVRSGQAFRTWIGFNQRYDDKYVRWWQIQKLLGTLTIKVAGHPDQQITV